MTTISGAFSRLAELLAAGRLASFRFSFSGSDPYPDQGTSGPPATGLPIAWPPCPALRGEPGIDTKRIGLLGMSVGGGVVVQAAALCRQVRCVVALAPVADGEAWLRHRWLATRSRNRLGRVRRRRRSGPAVRGDGQAEPQRAPFRRAGPARRKRSGICCLSGFRASFAELTLTSVWDTFRFKPLCYAEAVTQPLADRPRRRRRIGAAGTGPTVL